MELIQPIVYRCEPDMGIIRLQGDIKDSTIFELCDTINMLEKNFRYRKIRIDIASPGGSVLSLEHYIANLKLWEARGLSIETCALTEVASASAIILSLGNQRSAWPNAKLLYHHSRISGHSAPLTADKATKLSKDLVDVDNKLRKIMEERIETSSEIKQVYEDALQAKMDLHLLEDVQVRLAKIKEKNPERAENLRLAKQFAKKFCEDVGAQLKKSKSGKVTLRPWFKGVDNVGPVLMEMYDAINSTELWMSPYLARHMGLIDQILGEEHKSVERSKRFLKVKEWGEVWTGGRIPVENAQRHFMMLGETGCGKTVSAVLPILKGLVKHGNKDVKGPDGHASLLVIDPKGDIKPALKEMSVGYKDRIVDLNKTAGKTASKTMKLMLDKDVEAIFKKSEDGKKLIDIAQCGVLVQKLLDRCASVDPASEMHVAKGKRTGKGDPYFSNSGMQIAEDMVKFALIACASIHIGFTPEDVISIDEDDSNDESSEESAVRACMKDFLACITEIKQTEKNFLFSVQEIASLFGGRTITGGSTAPDKDIAPGWAIAVEYYRKLREKYVSGTLDFQLLNRLARDADNWLSTSRARNQYVGVHGTANTMLRPFSAGIYGSKVMMGIEWQYLKEAAASLHKPSDGDNTSYNTPLQKEMTTSGKIYIYQPDTGADAESSAMVVRTLKMLFFEQILKEKGRIEEQKRWLKGGSSAAGKYPLVGYIADEFQNFITSDPVHGEQSFIDKCRAFGVVCVLATQSIESIHYSLTVQGGAGVSDAVNILLINTGTKIFMRTTAPETINRINTIAPKPLGSNMPKGINVADARPPTSLKPGQAWVFKSDGSFGLYQLNEVSLGEEKAKAEDKK